MFDGAMVADAVEAATEDPGLEPPAASDSKDETPRQEIAIIDSSLPNYGRLIEGLDGNVRVLVLNDGATLAGLADALSGEKDLDAIHLMTHGDVGQISLGDEVLNVANLDDHSASLRAIGATLSQNGDLLLYGCDVTADGAGQSFVDQIAVITGADVAASDDLTGHKAMGGDWELEYAVGLVETENQQVADWMGTMHTNSVGFVIDNGSEAGKYNVEIFYGSWHSGNLSPEGKALLFSLRAGGDSTLHSDYTVVAYGDNNEGSGDNEYAFTRATTSSKITFSNENGSHTYTKADIEAAGFVPGASYFWVLATDNSKLHDTNVGAYSSVLNHQSAVVPNVAPGTYRIDYEDPKPASATWSQVGGTATVIFTLSPGGGLQVQGGTALPAAGETTEKKNNEVPPPPPPEAPTAVEAGPFKAPTESSATSPQTFNVSAGGEIGLQTFVGAGGGNIGLQTFVGPAAGPGLGGGAGFGSSALGGVIGRGFGDPAGGLGVGFGAPTGGSTGSLGDGFSGPAGGPVGGPGASGPFGGGFGTPAAGSTDGLGGGFSGPAGGLVGGPAASGPTGGDTGGPAGSNGPAQSGAIGPGAGPIGGPQGGPEGGAQTGGPEGAPQAGPQGTAVSGGPQGLGQGGDPQASAPQTSAPQGPAGPGGPAQPASAGEASPAQIANLSVATTPSGFQVSVAPPGSVADRSIVVLNGISDVVSSVEGVNFRIPADAFAVSTPDAKIQISAVQSDGTALPNWLSFDQGSGQFTGVPPAGFSGSIEVAVIATDESGNQVTSSFKVNVGVGIGDNQENAPQPPAQAPTPSGQQSSLSPDGDELIAKHEKVVAFQGRVGLSEKLASVTIEGRLARQAALVDAAKRAIALRSLG